MMGPLMQKIGEASCIGHRTQCLRLIYSTQCVMLVLFEQIFMTILELH